MGPLHVISAMGTSLLCWVVIWILGTGSTNAGVTQNPRHLVRRTGQEAILTCSPEKGHSYFYWYQQFLGEGLKFMIYLQKETILDQSGMPKKRFSTEFSKDGFSILKIQPAELGDSAVYFCASS